MLARLATASSSALLTKSVAQRALLPCLSVAAPILSNALSRRYQSTTASSPPAQQQENVIILGAAGRDFHDFITYWSKLPTATVRCFTGTQIPGIDHRTFPPEMCNNNVNGDKYPNGLPIYPQGQLEQLIDKYKVDTCALAYSDLSYDKLQSLASRVNAAGAKFVQLPPALTMISSATKPIVSICASRTGVGKSQTTRYVANYYKNEKGLKVAVVRHPMPYDQVLLHQRCQRYEKLEDMDKYKCTIEEEEEYYLHIQDGNLLFAGVDYPMILREAEKEADVILWDGGNNDVPFFKPDLHLCLVDALRPIKDQLTYYPGETNLRMADAVLITKASDQVRAAEYAQYLKSARITKRGACTPIYYGWSLIVPQLAGDKSGVHTAQAQVEAAALVQNKRVLVIDDGPTLTHGGMPYGAGYVLAQQLGAAEILDPRPFAHGSIKETFAKFPHLENALPAMGYDPDQIHDLQATIQATPPDTVVVIGTPSDFTHLVDLGGRQAIVASYSLQVAPEHEKDLRATLDSFYDRFYQTHHHAA